MSEIKFVKLTEEEFESRFNMVMNHFYADPCDCPFGGGMFETYGQEVEYINNIMKGTDENLKRRIWTILDSDGVMCFVSGYHFVNRFGYLITEEEVEEGTEYTLELMGTEDEEEE
jgi:hypothetical protein